MCAYGAMAPVPLAILVVVLVWYFCNFIQNYGLVVVVVVVVVMVLTGCCVDDCRRSFHNRGKLAKQAKVPSLMTGYSRTLPDAYCGVSVLHAADDDDDPLRTPMTFLPRSLVSPRSVKVPPRPPVSPRSLVSPRSVKVPPRPPVSPRSLVSPRPAVLPGYESDDGRRGADALSQRLLLPHGASSSSSASSTSSSAWRPPTSGVESTGRRQGNLPPALPCRPLPAPPRTAVDGGGGLRLNDELSAVRRLNSDRLRHFETLGAGRFGQVGRLSLVKPPVHAK